MHVGAYANRQILITGGLGFIGSHLARALVNLGAHVTLVDCLLPTHGGNLFNVQDIREKVDIHQIDVRAGNSMAHLIRGKHVLFNLAGQTSHLDSMIDPKTDLEINAAAQLSILEACRHHNREVRVVFASTRQVYGRPRYLPVDEQHPILPVDVNGINKLAGEQYHLLYCAVYGIRACTLRLTNTYGPAMRVKDARQTFLGVWIRSVLSGEPFEVFGDGLQRRDFNFVDDVVGALMLAGCNDELGGRVFNLGGDEVVSLCELATLLVNVNGDGMWSLRPFPADRKSIDIGDYFGSYRAFQRATGWQPRVTLAEGLRKTLAYYNRYLENYV